MTAPERVTQRYHLKNVRTLLTEGFTDEELRQFCFDNPAFQPFYPHLPQPASRAELARVIVQYARQKSLLETLLAWAKEQNPARYETHQPYEIPLDSPTPVDEVYFDPDLEPLLPAPEQVMAHRAALARKAEYRRWADEFYIREESKILPLLASPYDEDSGQQRQDLLQTIRAHERLLVLGEPGMGKTVALERMMWETAQADEPVVPVFVPLLFFQGDLIEAIRVALSETGELHFDEPKTVRAFLRQTRCLIMFDGLNEVPGQQREKVVGAIADFLREFSHHRYLITSRSQDEFWQKLRATEVIKEAVVIQRITDEQAQRYLMAHLGEKKGKRLHDRLDERLRGLSHTPLLLWMIKEVGLEGKELPGNQGELFDLFVGQMLTRDEKLNPKLPWWVKKRALAYLALTLQQAHQLVCERETARRIMTESEENYNPEVILNESLRHGLLQGERHVRFLHQTVQEYFVGLALYDRAKAEKKLSTLQKVSQRLQHRNLAAWARDDWWAESFVHMAGLTEDTDWLVRELAPVKPWLAFWCSIEGKPVDAKTQALIEKKTVAVLGSPDVQQRRRAVSQLSRLENPRTIAPLIEALKDNDEGVVNLAVEALAKLGEPAVNPLLTVLSESKPKARWAATRALGQIWDLTELVKLGDDTSIISRVEAAVALGKLADARAVEPLIAVLKDGDEVRRFAVWALGNIGVQPKDTSLHAQAVEPLIASLKDKEDWVRLSGAEVLEQFGENVVESLIAALKDSDWQVRYGAIEVLGKLSDARAVEPLVTILNDDDTGMRSRAAEVLGKLSDTRAVEPLIAALKDSDPDVRWSVASALGRLGDTQAVEPLIAALKDSDNGVRWRAAKGLGELGDARAVEPLIVALKDSDRYMQQIAAEVLERLGERAVKPLIAALKDSDWQVRWSVAEVLERLGESAVKPLIAALKDSDRSVRSRAAAILGRLADARAVEPLIDALKDNDWDVRQIVAWALGRLGDTQAMEPLIAVLQDPDPDVRLMAVISLTKLDDTTRIVEPFTIALKDDDWWIIRREVAWILGQLRDTRAVKSLIVALQDPFRFNFRYPVRKAAAEALHRIGTPEALAAVREYEARKR